MRRTEAKRPSEHVRSASLLAAAAVLATALGFDADIATAQSVNTDEIFWCEGRPIGDQTPEECAATRGKLLAACTGCHTFAPIVVAQKPAEEWDGFLAAHRPRVQQMSDADFAEISEFIKIRFNPDNPVPELPPALLNYALPAE